MTRLRGTVPVPPVRRETEVSNDTSEYRARSSWRRAAAMLAVRASLAVSIFVIVYGVSGSIEAAFWTAWLALTPARPKR